MTYEDYFEKVRIGTIDLIREGWAKRALARNKDYAAVDWNDDTAVAWCLAGAVYCSASMVWENQEDPNRSVYLCRFADDWTKANAPPGNNVMQMYIFNDQHNKEEVIASLERTIPTEAP